MENTGVIWHKLQHKFYTCNVVTDMKFHLVEYSKNNQDTNLLSHLYTSSLILACSQRIPATVSSMLPYLIKFSVYLPLLCIAFDSEWKSSIVPIAGAMSLKSCIS
jgi:hypothetical protein